MFQEQNFTEMLKGTKFSSIMGKNWLHSISWIGRSEHKGKGRNQWPCFNSLTLLALHVNRLFMHHFACEKKLVWLAFSVYWLLITNWKNVYMHFGLLPWKIIEKKGQDRNSSSHINSKEFTLKKKKYKLTKLYFSLCCKENGNCFISWEKPFKIGG